ncbi:hypothetical protein P168DRAFT_289567 [Aspergillus campestris IBT 28561]|uniref:DUF6314 domain-containing protein n=1 Tax=Aspergillus campestris (strain IBT 28561) TaxID=1392248 RepID=A0A2I1D497_ASPC2|nr:uncharacterized protein P168DRAFT_289567 [Aspergillus campestris IBT 28561]PKY04693.1 hypothetical protein P168DRAFT_289567 [Aspergillus campestris IBT 28561]
MPSIPQIFSSLRDTPRWTLHRTLKSANPQDIQGSLRGTASFTPLTRNNNINVNHTNNDNNKNDNNQDILYSEEGSVPTGPLAGLRFSKKYIWRFTSTPAPNGSSTSTEPTEGVSVWFVKPSSTSSSSTPPGNTDTQKENVEADYLFHEFEVLDAKALSSAILDDDTFVTPPVPPADNQNTDNTTTVVARGNHLCINDMYRTAYAFRVGRDSGDVLSWASRHVVRGPKKDQDIVNYYTREMA